MNIKQFIKTYLIILILTLIVFLLFFPIKTEYLTNYTIHHSIIDLGFADYGVFSALIVGLLSFTATIYTNNKNLNLIKLSSNSEDILTLIIKIENSITYQKLEKNLSSYDRIQTFINLLKIVFMHENAFKLIYPELHKDLMNFISENSVLDLNSKIPEKNAQIIMCDIKLKLLDEIGPNKKNTKLKDSKLCTDDFKFYNIEEMIDVEFNTKELLKYIENIKGCESKKYSKKKFSEFNKFIDRFINKLEEETKIAMNF